jgi:hypothetical protein
MGKIGGVAVILVLVVCTYLMMLVVMPFVSEVVSTANTTMAASSNMSNYPGTGEAVLSTPWALWFLPGVIGTAAVVIILKR